jgi:hypothetical protein
MAPVLGRQNSKAVDLDLAVGLGSSRAHLSSAVIHGAAGSRVEVVPMAAHGHITEALLALDRRGGRGMEARCDHPGRSCRSRGAVVEARDVGVEVVWADRRPADLAAGVGQQAADQREPRQPQMRSAQDDHRAGRVRDDVVAHRAQEHACEAPAAA